MFPYEKLEVYKKAKSTHSQVIKSLKEKRGMPSYLKTQFGRAALSIPLNIAEGSGRFTKKDRRHFFIMARGSTFECAAITEMVTEEGYVEESAAQNLKNQFDEISRILFTMIRNLEKPD